MVKKNQKISEEEISLPLEVIKIKNYNSEEKNKKIINTKFKKEKIRKN